MPEAHPTLFAWQDKLEHLLLFAALGLLGIAAWPRGALPLAAGLLAYGAAIEVAQSFTAYRTGDVWDWAADALGVAAAVGLRMGRPRVIRSRRAVGR